MGDFDPIWRGTKDTTERLGSPVITRNGNGWKAERTYDGVFETLLATAPAPGQKMDDLGNMEVDNTKITPVGGGAGTMVVTLFLNTTGGLTDNSEDTPVFEVEWLEIQKDITRHPRYQSDGSDALNTDEFTILKKARQGDQDSIDLIKNRTFSTDPLAKLWAKIAAGEEDYVEYIPLVTETITTRKRPSDTAGECGVIDQPPSGSGAPAYYKWLRTAYSIEHQGTKWTLKRQWTGAWWIDTEIYDS